jgi:hypothetical protein
LVNIDAALFFSSRHMGACIVIRDHVGMCVAACNNNIEEIIIPELAEAYAVRLSLSFARDEGSNNVQLATDRLSVV